MSFTEPDRQARLAPALATIAIHVVLVAALFVGFRDQLPAAVGTTLEVFDVKPLSPPPPPPPRRNPKPSHKREGAASPPNLRSTPTEIVAPKPVIVLPAPQPVVVAERPATGSDPTMGSAALRGPGTGSGGTGNGTGSGGEGDGDGDGGDDTPPRQLRGRLSRSDYPRDLFEAGVGGTVSVKYHIDEEGRVDACAVTRSSGTRALDALTCRLIGERFRFDPSRDARGNPVGAYLVENHRWDVGR